MDKQQVKLISLFLVFFKLGALTFGGGLAMLPIIRKEIVGRKWISDDDFDDYIVVSQVAPGMIAINIATLTGQHIRKRLGALVSVIGVALPSIIVITIIAAVLSEFSEIEIVQNAMKGIILVVVILLGAAIIQIGKKAIVHIGLAFYALMCFSAVYFFDFSTIYIILISFLLGTLHTIAFKYWGQKDA